MRFTEYAIKHLKAGTDGAGNPRRKVYTETGVSPDLRGLQLVVSPAGSKTFMLRFKVAGKARYLTLGNWPTVSLADAHKRVQEHRSDIREGRDPRAWHAEARKANTDALTLRQVFEHFRDTHLNKKLKRPEHPAGIIEKHLLRKFGHRKAASITRRELIAHLRDVAEQTPRGAHMARTLAAQLFAHAVNEDLDESLAASPAVALPVIGSAGQLRKVTLTEQQLRDFWHGLDRAAMVPQIRAALRFLLVTGQRRQEVALARWEHINRAGKTWMIPAENSKNGKTHVVPLSALALELLDDFAAAGRRKHKDGTETVSAFLVPSRSVTDRATDPHALTRAVAKNADIFNIPKLSPHALRHAVATGLSALGVERLHVAKVLNHSDRDITARYDSHDYMPEKRAALDRWGRHLRDVLSGEPTRSGKGRSRVKGAAKPARRASA